LARLWRTLKIVAGIETLFYCYYMSAKKSAAKY